MATIGEQLLQPETGWKRYDDTDNNISYESNGIADWLHESGETWDVNYYKSSLSYIKSDTESLNIKIKFNFTGTKIRLIAFCNNVGYRYSENIQIKIDNKIIEKFSEYADTKKYQNLVYEKIGLLNKEHYVEITNKTNYSMSLDAIDIDENGELKPYNPKPYKYLIQDKNNILYSLDKNNEYIPKKDYSSNLVAKWVFDDTNKNYVNENTVYDLSGKGNDLTSYNITYQDDDDLGRCAYFNGVNGYMIANNPVISKVNNLSILIKFKSSSENTDGALLDNASWYSVNKGITIGVSPATKSIKVFGFKGVSGNPAYNLLFNNLINNNKYNLLFTKFNNSKVSLFINDFLTPFSSIDINENELISTSNLFIGKSQSDVNKFKGYIQSIEIYNKVIEFNTSPLVQAPSQILDEDNFKNNGFSDIAIVTKEWLLSKFTDLNGLKLLVYTDDLEKKECEMIYNCNPYKPIDKLKENNNGKFDILMKEV